MNDFADLFQQIDELDLWESELISKRNQYLKMAGNIDTNIYYIISGSLKISIFDEVTEHIVRFGYRGNLISDLDSFITEKPSDFQIQIIKKAKLKVISKSTFLNLINQNAELKNQWQMILQQLILQQIEREKDLLISSPKTRYHRVLARSPQLFQEIPHKHIASYLRMSPETLSRLQKS